MRRSLPRVAKRKRSQIDYSYQSDDSSPSPTRGTSQVSQPAQTSQVLQTVQPPRKSQPQLQSQLHRLIDNSEYRLKIGVDFGTANTCASFVVLEQPNTPILDYVGDIENLHAQGEEIRFPTIMAVQPTKGRTDHARVVFATDATEALELGNIRCDHMIKYPKLALIHDIESIHMDDRPLLLSIQERHRKTLELAATFEHLTVVFPGGEEEAIKLTSMDDVIVACLKYFFALVKKELRSQLSLSEKELEQVFERKTEIGFAAPAFWTDPMLNEFLHLIQAAGWPTHCRIWSEPKCALAAHISTKLSKVKPTTRDYLWNGMNRAMIICDIGSGTTDLATLKPRELKESIVKFESITEGEGSLCGGRLLDFNIERQMRSKLGSSLTDVRTRVSNDPNNPVTEDDFFQGFDFGQGRQNFDGTKDIYQIRYCGNNLPSGSYDDMTLSAITLSKNQMVIAHKDHSNRVIKHIERQLSRTREELKIRNQDLDIDILLIGGVTRTAYLVSEVKSAFSGRKKVTVRGSIEAHDKPLVAVGCILCLSEPSIGKRFVVKQAYGIPISKKFDPTKHSIDNQSREDEARKGIEARDIIDWIVPVGTKLDENSKPTSLIFDWELRSIKKDGTPRLTNPINDSRTYPLVIEQDIFSTTSRELSTNNDLEYKKHPKEVKNIHTLEISLSKEECLEISEAGDDIGWFRDPATKNWLFWVQVRVVLEWHDVRASWRAEIPRTGSFIDGVDGELWSKEVKFATPEHHGHGIGDEK